MFSVLFWAPNVYIWLYGMIYVLCLKEAIATERDMLKQSLELLTENIEELKQDNEALGKDKEALLKDKETLVKDIEERKDVEDFEKLEEESKKDYEVFCSYLWLFMPFTSLFFYNFIENVILMLQRELEAEITALKNASRNTEDLVQKLKVYSCLLTHTEILYIY